MRATVAAVKRMRPLGWADFKHKLYRLGVIASPVDDVPEAWKAAFIKTFRKG